MVQDRYGVVTTTTQGDNSCTQNAAILDAKHTMVTDTIDAPRKVTSNL